MQNFTSTDSIKIILNDGNCKITRIVETKRKQTIQRKADKKRTLRYFFRCLKYALSSEDDFNVNEHRPPQSDNKERVFAE